MEHEIESPRNSSWLDSYAIISVRGGRTDFKSNTRTHTHTHTHTPTKTRGKEGFHSWTRTTKTDTEQECPQSLHSAYRIISHEFASFLDLIQIMYLVCSLFLSRFLSLSLSLSFSTSYVLGVLYLPVLLVWQIWDELKWMSNKLLVQYCNQSPSSLTASSRTQQRVLSSATRDREILSFLLHSTFVPSLVWLIVFCAAMSTCRSCQFCCDGTCDELFWCTTQSTAASTGRKWKWKWHANDRRVVNHDAHTQLRK